LEELEEPGQEEELVVGVGVGFDDFLEVELAVPATRSAIAMDEEIVRFEVATQDIDVTHPQIHEGQVEDSLLTLLAISFVDLERFLETHNRPFLSIVVFFSLPQRDFYRGISDDFIEIPEIVIQALGQLGDPLEILLEGVRRTPHEEGLLRRIVILRRNPRVFQDIDEEIDSLVLVIEDLIHTIVLVTHSLVWVV
jgi:hypothetical protein